MSASKSNQKDLTKAFEMVFTAFLLSIEFGLDKDLELKKWLRLFFEKVPIYDYKEINCLEIYKSRPEMSKEN